MDVRLYFKRKERDKVEKMQGSGQFEISGLILYTILYIFVTEQAKKQNSQKQNTMMISVLLVFK